jgi:hypothetical protein
VDVLRCRHSLRIAATCQLLRVGTGQSRERGASRGRAECGSGTPTPTTPGQYRVSPGIPAFSPEERRRRFNRRAGVYSRHSSRSSINDPQTPSRIRLRPHLPNFTSSDDSLRVLSKKNRPGALASAGNAPAEAPYAASLSSFALSPSG